MEHWISLYMTGCQIYLQLWFWLTDLRQMEIIPLALQKPQYSFRCSCYFPFLLQRQEHLHSAAQGQTAGNKIFTIGFSEALAVDFLLKSVINLPCGNIRVFFLLGNKI